MPKELAFYTEGHGMSNKRRPMLCCDVNLDKLQYPAMGFPKIDGVRIVNMEGPATARTLMPHKNVYTTTRFSLPIYRGIDGEGTLGSNLTSNSLCRDTSSALSTIAGEPDIKWNAFDFLREDVLGLVYLNRYKALEKYIKEFKPKDVVIVPFVWIKNKTEAELFYKKCLKEGYEGAIYRDPHGLHKDGRATENEATYGRLKPSSDKEALVLRIVEAQANLNEKKKNALGLSERSSHKANKVGKGMVGMLECLDLETKKEINVGPGKMKHDERIYYFNHQDELVQHYIKYESTDTGVKDAPRFARYICIRPKEDIV